MKKALVHLFLLGIMGTTTLGTSVTAYATAGSSEEALNLLERKEDAALEELAGVSAEIAENQAKARELVADMQTTREELKDLGSQYDKLNDVILQRQDLLSQQARAIQVNGETENYLRFLLQADSITDALGRFDVVTQMMSASMDLVKKQMADIDEVAVKQEAIEEKAKEQTLLAAKLEAAKSDMEQQLLEKEVIVSAIAAEKAVVATERERYLAAGEAAKEQAATIAATKTAFSSNTVQETVSQSGSISVAGGKWETIKRAAFNVQGVPYVYGGSTTSGFDCSGFTSYVFAKAGISLPRTASGQYAAATKIAQSEAKPGDLIFFNQTGSIDHVGIYLGNGQFIGSQSSTGVAVAQISPYYWAKYVAGYGRIN